MAKRFTDTEKWKDLWFQDLSGELKLFYFFVLDNCDCAGIWKVNFKLFEFQSGFKLNREEVKKSFEGKINFVNNDLAIVPKFIPFQYGNLGKGGSGIHKGIVKAIEYHNLQSNPYLTLPIELANPKGNPLGTIKDKAKDKDICITGTALEITPSEKKSSKPKSKTATPKPMTSPLASLFKPDDEIQAWLIGEGASEYVQKELLESFSHHVLAEEVKTAYQWQLEKKPRNAGLFLKKWLTNKNHNPIYNPEPKKTLSDELGDFFKTYAPKEEIIDAELT